MTQDEHVRRIGRLLGGENVNGAVGIRLRGGPSDAKVQIMLLDAQGLPPPRTRRRQGDGSAQVYQLRADPNERAGRIYEFKGFERISS